MIGCSSGRWLLHAVRVLTALVGGAFALLGLSEASAPTPLFTASTVSPAVDSLVLFADVSTGSPTSWSWDFGDGSTSRERNPAHVFRSAGTFSVRLTASNGVGSASGTVPVTVTPADVLRLNAAHPFDVTLTARDPRTGDTGSGAVLGQNDVYGYFAIPGLSGNPASPELLVKVIDASASAQNYWVFYGALTDFDFTLSVRENATGIVKTYVKDASNDPTKAAGQFDTSGFAVSPTPAVPETETVTIETKAWEFSPGTSTPIVLTVGHSYRLRFHDVDPAGTMDPHHGFTGISELGLSGTSDVLIGPDQDFVTEVLTPQPFQRGVYPFACTNTDCGGDPQQHATMVGTILVQ